MSEKFRGITFAEQAVTPADDAIVRRAILPDGFLTGCEISYSGSTLTMAAGYIIACGRSFQHIAAENWAVVDQTSGFARLVLTIDLSQTSTEETFNQITTSIEYASAVDGFVQLEQSDINLSGTRYQIAACVVSLGTGGITGIVYQLPLSRAEGGGLNFSVVDGLTQPGDPKENMIWVLTENMTGWYLQPTQPENMAEGEVWISTGLSSQAAFNAAKKNVIMLYPLSAKQMMENGALVDRVAKIYQNGEWSDLITYLFKSGEGEKVSFNRDNGSGVTVSETKTSIKGTVNNIVGGEWYWQTDDKQSLNGKSKLVFVAKCTYQLDDGNESYEGKFIVLDSRFTDCVSPNELSIPVRASVTLVNDSSKKEYIIDVSALNGSYIIAYWGVASVEIYDVFMR